MEKHTESVNGRRLNTSIQRQSLSLSSIFHSRIGLCAIANTDFHLYRLRFGTVSHSLHFCISFFFHDSSFCQSNHRGFFCVSSLCLFRFGESFIVAFSTLKPNSLLCSRVCVIHFNLLFLVGLW